MNVRIYARVYGFSEARGGSTNLDNDQQTTDDVHEYGFSKTTTREGLERDVCG